MTRLGQVNANFSAVSEILVLVVATSEDRHDQMGSRMSFSASGLAPVFLTSNSVFLP